jgi:hypothetical protein
MTLADAGAMMRIALVFAVAAIGCNSSGLAAGLAADMGAPACPAMPSAPSSCFFTSTPFDCNYGDQVCTCSSQGWFCRSSLCPSANVANAEGSCTTSGLTCNYGFENSCTCLAPENRWYCCGGAPICPSPLTEGALCCGHGSSGNPTCLDACIHGVRRVCECMGEHLHCIDQPCGDGGV